jgi:hypothetical protein
MHSDNWSNCLISQLNVVVSLWKQLGRWSWWVTCLDGTIGRVLGNYAFIVTFVSREMFMFHAMLAVSSQSSMIILSECNLRGTHGNNPRHQTSSMFQVIKHQVCFKWTWWVICFDGTIGRLPENCTESYQVYKYIRI